MPDNYTIVDRNVDGPRAWYGRFNYAATYHAKAATETATGGHETLMGAMTVDERYRPRELDPRQCRAPRQGGEG